MKAHRKAAAYFGIGGVTGVLNVYIGLISALVFLGFALWFMHQELKDSE